MQVKEIKGLLEKINDSNLELFVKAINNNSINQDSKIELLTDLGNLLESTKTEVDKKRIDKYINKINNLKSKEQEEKNNDLLEINFNY